MTLVLAVKGYALPVLQSMIASYSLHTWFVIAFALVTLFIWIKTYIFYRCSEYGITNKRVLMKTGWIQRNSLEMFLDKIEAIHVDQTVLGRLLGYGTLMIVGTGGSRDPFVNVPRPLHFRKMVQQEIDDYIETHYKRR